MADDFSDWEKCFDEVYSFVSSLGGGRISYANQPYTEHVLERLGHCVHSLTTLVEHLQSEELDDDVEEVISSYHTQLSRLLHCMRQITADWQAHFDQLQMNNGRPQGDSAYKPATTMTSGPGRPKFAIIKGVDSHNFHVLEVF